ncbi:MAG: glutamate synthase large subunit [Kiritimatiellae bacterium]|nr:glutamate synthase large subunit [Kiritimatiellia bacterium]
MKPAAEAGQRAGLYAPEFEHDACGVGMVCRLDGQPSHQIVRQGIEVLVNLTHRGACGCDERTGDGAGILIQLPDGFLRKVAPGGRPLPPAGAYAVGNVFLPRDPQMRAAARATLDAALVERGLEPLGWRPVPVREEVLGRVARDVKPEIEQVFVGSGVAADREEFERRLYVARKLFENRVRQSDWPERGRIHVCSLSSRTLVYKGLMLADQMAAFYPDLDDPDLVSALAIVHQRYSTNTFPSWDLAQPFRYLCHNGEINTLRGNIHWMAAREAAMRSERFGDDLARLRPICTPGASDTATLDNVVELLVHTGRSLPHALMMLIPEAWEHHDEMDEDRRAFYEYHAALMEPWDGPASIVFTDGDLVGAVLDRNGLRPSRYTVTRDGRVVLASEVGVLDCPPETIERQGRLEAGRIFLVDLRRHRLVDDEEIKADAIRRRPWRAWIRRQQLRPADLPAGAPPPAETAPLTTRLREFGYSREDLEVLVGPMAERGEEPVGSMGTDVPLAILSERPRLMYDYFHQLFAQVTNPPLDAIREELVTSLTVYLGSQGNLFDEEESAARQVRLDWPMLDREEMNRIRALDAPGLRAAVLTARWNPHGGGAGLEAALSALAAAAETEVRDRGRTIVVLTDRGSAPDTAPIPMLLALGAVHHHLIRCGLRTRCGIVVDSGEPREVHHFAALFGYGAGAIHPYLALELVDWLVARGRIPGPPDAARARYLHAAAKGVLKTMSKMGISTLRSYCGAQQFEAVGLDASVVERCFAGTPSRVGGAKFAELAEEIARRHSRAWAPPPMADPAPEGSPTELEPGGIYKWRRDGEAHLLQPLAIAKLQQAVRDGNEAAFQEFCRLVDDQSRRLMTLRGLIRFREDPARAVPLEEVEPWTEITRRFKSGAMSYGSISQEAHETLAIAMNRIGGRSNSGEGGEDPERFHPLPGGDSRCSAIKQIASGRFGVTIEYLVNARELQIKIAQGAKPGEGGQLPAEKVYPWIARVRHSTPWVQLISPPPHHDIYSIEDLAQLIHDLRCANPRARITVKLVSEVGVGTVAAGVAKGKADVVLISGYDGGTGASPESSLKHAGLPWELGLAETQQTLVLNGLRDRIAVECDGKLLTGRDVAIACLLGAEEFGFATAPLIAMGCVMMRACHRNTCPVGIATQDPALRRKFAGRPEHVVNFFRFVAEDLRRWMARLGYRTVDEMVGQSHRLEASAAREHWKAHGLDLSRILEFPPAPFGGERHAVRRRAYGLEESLDHELIRRAAPALQFGRRSPVEITLPVRNVHRTVGTLLSGEIARRWGGAGLPEDTIVIRAHGVAGQSFGAFGAPGLTIHLEGVANDYFGKGLSGAKLTVRPPRGARYVAEHNIAVGNVSLYGATAGECYVRGRAGERFAVRNSGALAVVEGVGDHGCEYMTGGVVVVIGETGRNFAAGMSGGLAFVYDPDGTFARRCNTGMVTLEPLEEEDDIRLVLRLLRRHLLYTESPVAARLLNAWATERRRWVKVFPDDYRRALERMARETAPAAEPAPVAAG